MKVIIGVLSALLLVVSGCSGEERSPLKTSIYNADNDKIGTATLTEQPDGVQVKLKVEGLEPGMHAVHVHEFPKCETPDFKSAGNHFNPLSKEHGLMNPKGAHVGDMPNVEADQSGMIDTELMLPEAKMKEGQKSLLRDKGTSIVIHSGQDDGMTQPAGDAGERVACGAITLKADEDEASDPTEPDKKQEGN
ncbi:superoxide dismutase family protein [Halobacillus karajensis]|uniref:Superoxide dismutase [Cu-Zn] n=1 Tax=Halobacillus karajensis TaxID=195088 RepID=A0A024P9K1_9BACI|nr:superoxide dismutase family protein [Halobacillus karajensis]CDQ21310.1 Superoxide dismutase [Cu-Zn] precursor [Halobacillus karajensis]CDQ25620.1 Superoxide dismutase [Cu-Zn] precursor [Halobacillus karajensis]CDQ25891.1 Superoxide dismutase [Cu-Zn] precursor [Halobacillus karajensis]